MASNTKQWEGTWEEIAAHQAEFAGQRLRVQVLSPSAENDNLWLQVLQEIEERSRFMNPKPDTRDLLREGRSGDMYDD